MLEFDTITSLIEDIYDAALEPALWSDVIVSIQKFAGTSACGLISKDTATRAGTTHHYIGVDPHFIKLYADSHSRFDPMVTIPPFGKVVGIPDLVEFDEYSKGPFFQEWLRPQGCTDAGLVVLENSDSRNTILLTFLSGNRFIDPEMRRRIRCLVPHAHRALAINKAIQTKQAQAATFSDTFDAISAAIFFIGQNCRLVHANAAGQTMLSEDKCLRVVNGQLIASNMRANQALRAIFSPDGDMLPAQSGNALPMEDHDGDRYAAYVLPLTSAARGTIGRDHKAIGALFVRKMQLDIQFSSELMARMFELTPAETKVLLAIVEVGGVPEVAGALGIAETTVKTHLHRVFSKTGTNRQADLVKLSASFSNPLAN